MDFEIFIEKNEAIIRKAISSVCKKMFHTNTDCEECEGQLFLELVENDYKILKSFKGGDGSKLGAYLFSALYRKVIDQKRKEEGQYIPSKKAVAMGKCVIELEKRLFFGSSIQEAHGKMSDIAECKEISLDDAKKIENEIRREKTGKKKTETEYISDVDILYGQSKEESQETTTGKLDKDFLIEGIHCKDPLSFLENQESCENYQNVMRSFTEKLNDEDLNIFNMSFFRSKKVSEIARQLGRERYYVKTKFDGMLDDLKTQMSENNLSLQEFIESYNF